MCSRSLGMQCLLVFAAICSTSPVMAQFERLLDRVPNDANTLIIFDVDRLLSSPLATREKWKDKHTDDFTQGRVFVPPQAQRLVLAGRMDVEGMDYTWQLALMDLQKPVSVENIARKGKGLHRFGRRADGRLVAPRRIRRQAGHKLGGRHVSGQSAIPLLLAARQERSAFPVPAPGGSAAR